jgi:hypothetical protein
MQTFVVQREAADTLPVDASVTTPIPAGSLIGYTATFTAVLGGTTSPASTLIGIASADQDVDENTIDFFYTLAALGKWGVCRVHKVKLSVACNQYAILYLDVANGRATPTLPGSGVIILGVARTAGAIGALVDLIS